MKFNRTFPSEAGQLDCFLTIDDPYTTHSLFIDGQWGRYEIHLLPVETRREILSWIVDLTKQYAAYLRDMEQNPHADH